MKITVGHLLHLVIKIDGDEGEYIGRGRLDFVIGEGRILLEGIDSPIVVLSVELFLWSHMVVINVG